MPEKFRADYLGFFEEAPICLTLQMSGEFREQKKKKVNNCLW